MSCLFEGNKADSKDCEDSTCEPGDEKGFIEKEDRKEIDSELDSILKKMGFGGYLNADSC